MPKQKTTTTRKSKKTDGGKKKKGAFNPSLLSLGTTADLP